MSAPRKWPRGFCCYALAYPSGEVYYIGIGKGSRCSPAMSRNRWAQRIRDKIRREGGDVVVTVEEFLTREAAAEREVELIARHGRRDLGTGTLVNLTEGGEGSSGRRLTDQQRQRLSEAARGRVVTIAQRDRMSQLMRGNNHAQGHRHSQDTRRHLSICARGRKLNLSEEERKARSDRMRERNAADPSLGRNSIGNVKKVKP